MLNEALRRWPKRWRGLDDDTKTEFVVGLKEANQTARAHLQDPDRGLDAAKAVAQIVGVATKIEAQIQADDHVEDKNRRLDEGKPTERLAGSVSDAEVVAFFLGIGAPEKMPAALLERYKAGEFRD